MAVGLQTGYNALIFHGLQYSRFAKISFHFKGLDQPTNLGVGSSNLSGRAILRRSQRKKAMPMNKSSVVHSDPDIMGGTPVFVGTRVPVQALIDYLEGGHSLQQFLDDFPTVTRELAIAALEQAKAHLIADARVA